jgi:hypothetical protein
MVSPNDHVVMNHEDQTRTNDVWGHVRYTNKPNEQGEYLNLGNTGEGILKKIKSINLLWGEIDSEPSAIIMPQLL